MYSMENGLMMVLSYGKSLVGVTLSQNLLLCFLEKTCLGPWSIERRAREITVTTTIMMTDFSHSGNISWRMCAATSMAACAPRTTSLQHVHHVFVVERR